jgi:hypothetical protein
MEYDGLVVRYPVNRLLTDEELQKQVEVRTPTSYEPRDAYTSIRQTGELIELVDKYYAWRGVICAVLLLPLLFFVWQVCGLAMELFGAPPPNVRADEVWRWMATGLFGMAIGLLICLLLAWAIGKESFTLTHFPIRFHRKTRMVYVFRPKRQADIIRVKWDDVFWHIRRNKNKQFGSYNWFVAGHVMAKDRKTVIETFAFGRVGSSPEEVYPQWEYVRRFMEGGAGAVPAPDVYLPIDNRREGFWWGAQTLLFNTPTFLVASVLLLPFTVLGVFTRWLCMLSNRVPIWPADIEAECAGPNDQRPAKNPTMPAYGKILLFIVLGLAFDAALLAWVFDLSSFAKAP